MIIGCTLTLALMLQKSRGATVYAVGFSVNFRSPSVANSMVRFWRVSAVWFTTSTTREQRWGRKKFRNDAITVEHDVVLVYVHIGLGINRVRKSRQLEHFAELGNRLLFLFLSPTSGLLKSCYTLEIKRMWDQCRPTFDRFNSRSSPKLFSSCGLSRTVWH